MDEVGNRADEAGDSRTARVLGVAVVEVAQELKDSPAIAVESADHLDTRLVHADDDDPSPQGVLGQQAGESEAQQKQRDQYEALGGGLADTWPDHRQEAAGEGREEQ